MQPKYFKTCSIETVNLEEKISSSLTLVLFMKILSFNVCVVDMSTAAFIEPLPVVEFVAQLLGKDVMSRPLSDSDRIKVLFQFCNLFKHREHVF